MGTMLLVAPKLKVKDPSGEIHKLRDRLASIPRELKEELSGSIASLTKQRSSLNLGKWTRGVEATALHWALLMVGDLDPLVKAHPEELRAGVLEKLTLYALTDAHLEARRYLGVTVNV